MRARTSVLAAIWILLFWGGSAQSLIIDHTCTGLQQVPVEWIRQARSDIKLTFGHTSHGSQIPTGMEALVDSFPVYQYFDDHAYYRWQSGSQAPDSVLSFWDYVPGGDLGNPDWVTWAGLTDTMLSNVDGAYQVYPHFRNVVMWSWCGQVSWADSATIVTYLSLMNGLEQSYPSVTFIYMTSHLDGTGAAGNLNIRNEQIRAYCRANNKVLFDFADIESYDPDGLVNYMELYGTDGCEYDSDGNGNPWGDANWAQQWIASHPGHELARLAAACGYCAHSERLNCIQKARAFWWMMARLAGWDGSAGVHSGGSAAILPYRFRIAPNPFTTACQIRLAPCAVVEVYDVVGRRVQRLSNTTAQERTVSWHPGAAASSGTYLLRMTRRGSDGKTTTATTKVLYLK